MFVEIAVQCRSLDIIGNVLLRSFEVADPIQWHCIGSASVATPVFWRLSTLEQTEIIHFRNKEQPIGDRVFLWLGHVQKQGSLPCSANGNSNPQLHSLALMISDITADRTTKSVTKRHVILTKTHVEVMATAYLCFVLGIDLGPIILTPA